MKLTQSNKFEANRWLIVARWFYAPAIFAMGLLSKLDPIGENIFPLPMMILLFSIFILINVLFLVVIKKLEFANNIKRINIFGTCQILAELAFFIIVLHFSGGVGNVAPIFFFIPIVSSIILFSPLGSLFIALVSGLLINGYLILENYGLVQNVFGYSGQGKLEYADFLTKLSTTVVITAVYFIVGSLSGYLSSALRKRELQLSESKRQTQIQSEKLQLLNEEYNSFARKLVRKDLELKKENAEITKLDMNRRDFVSTVAHQLRTPLSAIKWTINILLEESSGKLNTDQRMLLLKTYESNERIINLIQDMLGADKAEFKAANFSPVEISLPDLVSNVLPDFRSIVEKKNLKIEVQSEKNLPKAYVDPQKIRAVFQNLIENAIKYSKRGGWIKITIAKDGNKLKVSIEDNGIGIPESEQQNLFKKFFRAQNAIKMETNGTGLGLFIIKSLIEKHDGNISFESKENRGTKFMFTLPIATT